jgi:glycosyltransferase involved in cell wall biosynthesis
MTTVSPPAQLVIAGAGPLESDLRLLAHQLDLEQRVRFLGFEPNVLRWMQAADGFVLSSWWEGLSMALLEACSCALPLVASDVPGNREVIISQQSGLLATVGDVNALASAMTQIMTKTPKERLDMGLQARNHVLQKFSLNSVLDRWETLYTTLLDQHPHPTRFASRHLLSVDT